MIIHRGHDDRFRKDIRKGSNWRNLTRHQIVQVDDVGQETMGYKVTESTFDGKKNMTCSVERFLRLYRPIK